MDDLDKGYNEIMALLKTVPGVEEYLNSPEVQEGKEQFRQYCEQLKAEGKPFVSWSWSPPPLTKKQTKEN